MKIKNRGTKDRPRVYIFKSNKHIYAQIINDTCNQIIVSSSSLAKEIKHQIKGRVDCETVKLIGKDLAKKSHNKGIKNAIFDRGTNKYHGKIKVLAESLREFGLIL